MDMKYTTQVLAQVRSNNETAIPWFGEKAKMALASGLIHCQLETIGQRIDDTTATARSMLVGLDHSLARLQQCGRDQPHHQSIAVV